MNKLLILGTLAGIGLGIITLIKNKKENTNSDTAETNV